MICYDNYIKLIRESLLFFSVEVAAEDGPAGIQAVCSVAAWRLRYQILRETVDDLAIRRWKISLCTRGMCINSLCYIRNYNNNKIVIGIMQ